MGLSAVTDAEGGREGVETVGPGGGADGGPVDAAIDRAPSPEVDVAVGVLLALTATHLERAAAIILRDDTPASRRPELS